MKKSILILAAVVATTAISCKKKGCTDPTATNYSSEAEKDDGSCEYSNTPTPYTVPTTYVFQDADGNSTVSYSGQTERLDQLSEIVTYVKSGISGVIDAQVIKDAFANVGGDGNGFFTFSSTKQLKNKCFTADQATFEGFMDAAAASSLDFASTASSGQAGTISSGSSTYLVDANGVENVQLIEKGLMGAVFMHQALNVYFGPDKMNVDNTSAVDPTGNPAKYYTVMEHHYDEAFGYFGVDIDFPTTIPGRFWGKYSNKQDPTINCNADMMDNFLMGRAAISNNVLADRDAAIQSIRTEWEDISAYQAMNYIDDAIGYFGNDNAKFLHALAEGWAFAWNLRYASEDTRRMSTAEHTTLMAMFKTNFWDMTVADLNAIKAEIDSKF